MSLDKTKPAEILVAEQVVEIVARATNGLSPTELLTIAKTLQTSKLLAAKRVARMIFELVDLTRQYNQFDNHGPTNNQVVQKYDGR